MDPSSPDPVPLAERGRVDGRWSRRCDQREPTTPPMGQSRLPVVSCVDALVNTAAKARVDDVAVVGVDRETAPAFAAGRQQPPAVRLPGAASVGRLVDAGAGACVERSGVLGVARERAEPDPASPGDQPPVCPGVGRLVDVALSAVVDACSHVHDLRVTRVERERRDDRGVGRQRTERRRFGICSRALRASSMAVAAPPAPPPPCPPKPMKATTPPATTTSAATPRRAAAVVPAYAPPRSAVPDPRHAARDRDPARSLAREAEKSRSYTHD